MTHKAAKTMNDPSSDHPCAPIGKGCVRRFETETHSQNKGHFVFICQKGTIVFYLLIKETDKGLFSSLFYFCRCCCRCIIMTVRVKMDEAVRGQLNARL